MFKFAGVGMSTNFFTGLNLGQIFEKRKIFENLLDFCYSIHFKLEKLQL